MLPWHLSLLSSNAPASPVYSPSGPRAETALPRPACAVGPGCRGASKRTRTRMLTARHGRAEGSLSLRRTGSPGGAAKAPQAPVSSYFKRVLGFNNASNASAGASPHTTAWETRDSPSPDEAGPAGQRPLPQRHRVPLLPPRGPEPQHTHHHRPSSTPPELGLQGRGPGFPLDVHLNMQSLQPQKSWWRRLGIQFLFCDRFASLHTSPGVRSWPCCGPCPSVGWGVGQNPF